MSNQSDVKTDIGWVQVAPRPMIEYVNEHIKALVGVELGVAWGVNAAFILESMQHLDTLYLVDSYPTFRDGNSRDGKKYSYANFRNVMLQRIAKFGKRAVYIDADTVAAATQIPDNLDFVYIDACHCYENVAAEIATYYPKVRSGGYIGGHDVNFSGVMRAVGEFAEANRLQPRVEGIDWMVRKP